MMNYRKKINYKQIYMILYKEKPIMANETAVTYSMTKERQIFRDVLEEVVGIYRAIDILLDAGMSEEVTRLAHWISTKIAMTVDDVTMRNILADEIGYEEYQKRLKEK